MSLLVFWESYCFQIVMLLTFRMICWLYFLNQRWRLKKWSYANQKKDSLNLILNLPYSYCLLVYLIASLVVVETVLRLYNYDWIIALLFSSSFGFSKCFTLFKKSPKPVFTPDFTYLICMVASWKLLIFDSSDSI